MIDLLLKLVAVSDWYSSSSSFGVLPDNWVILFTIASHFAFEFPIGFTMLHAAIAPALTNGVDGWSFSSRMAKMELNGIPVASAPILFKSSSAPHWFITNVAVCTFDTDSIPKMYFVSPISIVCPLGRHTDIPNRLDGILDRNGM